MLLHIEVDLNTNPEKSPISQVLIVVIIRPAAGIAWGIFSCFSAVAIA